MAKINLFYEQLEFDRWFALDRYPRRVVRRIVRGKARPGGHDLVFLNLRKGFDQLGVGYRINAYRHLRKHPEEVACIIGKPHVLDKVSPRTPVLFGAAQFSHPDEQPGFFARHQNVRKILVPGEWVREMWEPYFGDKVASWPVGIETDLWCPRGKAKSIDFIVYDKVRWDHDRYLETLITPILKLLRQRGFTTRMLRYGEYKEEEFHSLLDRTKAIVFLCEHETQGIAYQQALSSGVPILAWDRGGKWQDPNFYPHIAKFGPVSSVPYWDHRCGLKFVDAGEFETRLGEFLERLRTFDPRAYILENLTLEKCAKRYLEFVAEVQAAT